MELAKSTETLRGDGEAMAAVAAEAPTADVPGCPGWTIADLTAHTGTIHLWVTRMVSTRSQERLSRRDLPAPPDDPAELPAWFRSGLIDLLTAFEGADLDAPRYSFGADRSARFWLRRMIQETAVHRWDAESATGRATALAPELAADGIDEFHDVFVPLRPPVEEEGGLDLRATDRGTRGTAWTFPAPGGGTAAAEGTASDLLLFLWGRVGPDRLTVTGGDDAVLTRWQEAVRL